MNAMNLGEVAQKMLVGTGLIANFLHAMSIVVGVVLLIMAIAFYRAHRANPKFVPLDRPIIYLLLALVLFFLPHVDKLFGGVTQHLLEKSETSIELPLYDPDMPIECEE